MPHHPRFAPTPTLAAAGAGLIALASAGAALALEDGQQAVFTGELEAPAQAEWPDDGTARVALVQVSGDYSDPELVAEKELGSVTEGPASYELTVDGSKLEDGRQYALSATVTDGDGDTLWTRGELTAIEPMTGPIYSSLDLTAANDG